MCNVRTGAAQDQIKSDVGAVRGQLGSAAVMGVLVWQRARNILTQPIFDQLTSVRASKSAGIESYFQFMCSLIPTANSLSDRPEVVSDAHYSSL